MKNSKIKLYDYEGVLAPLGGIENLQLMCGADDFTFDTLCSHINRVKFRITYSDLNCTINYNVYSEIWCIYINSPTEYFPFLECYSASSLKSSFEKATKLSLDF